jgi:hypothetical protein
MGTDREGEDIFMEPPKATGGRALFMSGRSTIDEKA